MSGRKRKSQWDYKEESEDPSEFSKHNAERGREIHSSHPAKLSDLNSNNCPPWSYSETWQDNNYHGNLNEIPESTRTIRGAKGYSISPCFSGRGRQNHSPSRETSWSQVHRYQRSRSRSRGRGRAASRSRSRDRDRNMNEDRDYCRSRGRGSDLDENRDYPGSRDRGRDRYIDDNRDYPRRRDRDRDMDEDRDYPRGRGGDMDDNWDNLGSRLRDRYMDENRDYLGSRSRDKDMDEDRDYTRGRGRDRDTDKDSTRTRSALYDNRHVDDGLGDRKSGSRVSSQLCKDFAVGNCRRGSHCRFLHEDDLMLRDGCEPARERAERWRDRQEASEASSADTGRIRYHLPDKVSDYNRSNRSTSFDHNRRRQPHKNGNIPCKYFVMGRCNRDDCRFSHDDPEGGCVKGRLQYDRYPQHSDNENKYWNAPERGDRNGISDVNISKWRDSDVGTMNYTDRTSAKKQNPDRLDQNLNNETKSWNGPRWGDVTGVSDASTGWVDSNAGSVDFSEPAFGDKKIDVRYSNNLDNVMWNSTQNGSNIGNVETFIPTGGAGSFGGGAWHNARGSHYEAVDGSMSSQTYEQIIEGEPTQQLINNFGHHVVSESFDDQSDSRRGNNHMLTDDSSALNGVNTSETNMPLDVPDRIFGQKSDSVGSLAFNFSDTAQRNMIPLNPSSGHGIDLNGSDKQSVYLNPQNEPVTFSEEPTKEQKVFESEMAQADCGIHQNDMTSDQITEMNNLSASLNEILSKGQQLPELYAALNPNSNSSSLLTSLSSSAVVSPPVASADAQPNPTTMSEEQYVRRADTVEPSKYDKIDKHYEPGKPDHLASVLSFSTVEPSKHVSDSKPYELDKSAPSEYLLPLSNDGINEHGNNNIPYELQEPKLRHNILSSSITGDLGQDPKNCSPEKACQESPATKQLKPITKSVSQQDISVKSEKSKVEEEIPSAGANPEGCVREEKGVKDEKEMRLFKVALVEYVKEILKPTWKEGQMSRDVHKTIVKKVVDKVSSTVQGAHVPKTQEKIDQYLAHSKGKLTKLVQAYIERLPKS